jgi:hypothetical protein
MEFRENLIFFVEDDDENRAMSSVVWMKNKPKSWKICVQFSSSNSSKFRHFNSHLNTHSLFSTVKTFSLNENWKSLNYSNSLIFIKNFSDDEFEWVNKNLKFSRLFSFFSCVYISLFLLVIIKTPTKTQKQCEKVKIRMS